MYDKNNPPIMIVSRKGCFDAAHANPVIGGKCGRIHGHRYEYEIFARGPINPDTGIVVDFKELKAITKGVEEKLDHYFLNDVLPFITSAENVCYWIYEQAKAFIPEVFRVVLQETHASFVEYNEDFNLTSSLSPGEITYWGGSVHEPPHE